MHRPVALASLALLFAASSACGRQPSAPDGSAPATTDSSAPPADEKSASDFGLTPDAYQPACAPRPPVFSRSLFTQLLADLTKLRGVAARNARVDSFFAAVATAGGFPVRDASTVVFLYRSEGTEQVAVAGTFNAWKTSADLLTKLAESNLYFLEKPLGSARQEYKFVVGTSWLKDPQNPHVTWDGIPVAGPGQFNSVIPAIDGQSSGGRLEWHALHSQQLNNDRDIFVYLPPRYDEESCKRYPLLLVNDGNESITRSHFDMVASSIIAAGKAKPVIIAFVALANQDDRLSEYSCEAGSKGPQYTNFLCDTLVPWIGSHHRSSGSADERGIIGASMGGLISYAALFWRNDCLHRAAGQSGSYWYANEMMVKRVQTTEPPLNLLRAYLDNGGPDDNMAGVHDMRDALKTKGYPVFHWENPQQGHTWEAWQDRFDEALSYLYPP